MRETPSPAALPFGARALATFFGTGLLKPGPGTWTTLAAAAPLLLPIPPAFYGALTAALAVAAYLGCVVLATRPSFRPTLDQDPGWFTLDEACGMWIAAWRPEGTSLWSLLISAVAFRLLDIFKPPPIGRVQHVGGGHGIVLDDVLAGFGALAAGLAFDRFVGG